MSSATPRKRAGAGSSAEGVPAAEPAAGATPAKGKSGYRAKRSTGYRARSFYLSQELYDRARNAWFWTRGRPGGFESLSELVAAAITVMVEHLEHEHNDDRAFPPVPAEDAQKRLSTTSGKERQSQAMRAYWRERLGPDGANTGADEELTSRD